VQGVFTASAAEFLDRELFRHRSAILVGDVVVALAFLTGQLDDISHDQLPPLGRTKSSHLTAQVNLNVARMLLGDFDSIPAIAFCAVERSVSSR
jgi:hypothetical protein